MCTLIAVRVYLRLWFVWWVSFGSTREISIDFCIKTYIISKRSSESMCPCCMPRVLPVGLTYNLSLLVRCTASFVFFSWVFLACQQIYCVANPFKTLTSILVVVLEIKFRFLEEEAASRRVRWGGCCFHNTFISKLWWTAGTVTSSCLGYCS